MNAFNQSPFAAAFRDQGIIARHAPRLSPARSPRDDDASQRTRSRFVDEFPVRRTIIGGFNTIAIPGGFTVAAGNSAWFPLIDIVPQIAFGQDVMVYGWTTEMISTNNSDSGLLVDQYGVALANQAAWGDKFGNKAAIVIGNNLPINQDSSTWSTSPGHLPALQDALTADDTRYWDARKFPIGSMRDALPFDDKRMEPFAPFVFRVPQTERIQAALVIDGTQAQAGAGKTIVGFALVKILVGLTRAPENWASRP